MTRNRRSAKSAGSSFERLTADGFAWHLKDDRIERRVTNGSKDRGDISGLRSAFGERVVVECKDTTTLALGQWVTEADIERGNDDAGVGIVVHKRRGRGAFLDQYVTMTVRDLLRLAWGPDRPEPEPMSEVAAMNEAWRTSGADQL